MNILITGSSGLIGKKLKALLAQCDHTVFSLSHNDNKSTPEKDLTWSIKNNYVRVDRLKEIDAVIHLAGSNIAKPWTKKHKKSIYDSRVQGTKLLVEHIKKHPNRIKHFISTSAIGYYTDPSEETFNEDSFPGEGFLSEVCKDWEREAFQLQSDSIDVSIVRVGLVLSQNGGLFPIAAMTRKLGIVPNTGSPANSWSWIHIEDLVSIFQQLATRELAAGIYNAVSPYPCSQGEFSKAIIHQTKEKKQRLFPISFTPTIPDIFLKLLMGERSALPLTSQKISNKKLNEENFTYRFPTIKEAINQLIS